MGYREEMAVKFKKAGLKWERNEDGYRRVPFMEIELLVDRYLLLKAENQEIKDEAQRLYDNITEGSTDTDDLLRFVQKLGKRTP